jgi:hypothetical protein
MNSPAQNWVLGHFRRTFKLTDMMKSILEAEIPVTRRKILEFGAVFFIVLSVIVPVIVTWRNGWTWVAWVDWPLAAGIAMLVLCMVPGMMMAPVYKLWMRLALILGTIMTAVIVTIVFYLVITPIGLIRRLLRSKSDYKQTFDPKAESYWTDRTDRFDPSRMEKMY